ncbi:MAG: hypothetical protein P8Q15_01950 [Methylophilaceae bacterium]|nr:hypothetical protein [Methylophilaceae bacterium]
MSSVELTGKEDLCDVAALIKQDTDRDWHDSSDSFVKLLNDGCDFALHLGMIEALNSLALSVRIVDGKPQITAHVSLDDGHGATACKVLTSEDIYCREHCEVNITFDDEGDAVMTGEVVE